MKTVFIGGGRGCRAVLEMIASGQLGVLDLDILAVVDLDRDAPAMTFARQQGWNTLTTVEAGLGLPELELVIELTGQDEVLNRLHHHVRPGVRIMDHVMARVFWDLEKVTGNLRDELATKTALEHQLAKDRERLQEILDTIPDVVMVLDPDMRVVRVNRRFQEVTGHSRDEIVGRTCHEASCMEDGQLNGDDHRRAFEAVMASGHPFITTQRATDDPDGSHFQITASPIFDDAGQIIRVVQTSREITEQIRLKRDTELAEQRFRQIINTVHGIITIKDLDGRYQLVNPRAEAAYRLSQTDMLGRTDAELFDAEVAALMRRNDAHAMKKGGHHLIQESVRYGGRDRVLISERLPLADYKGEQVGVCLVARDVTRELEMQNDLISAERLAAIGKLAAGVAHELNNPLTGILTFAEDLFEESEDGDPAREDYRLIINETLRCRRIVQDLLDFSRQKAPARRRTGLGPVVQRTLTMLERQATFHNVEFVQTIPGDLPAVEIDPGQIQQAVLNLLVNARDAMDGCGVITIAAKTIEGGRAVALGVSDTGCGIPAAELSRIFEPFYSTKGEKGNGLGLPAVASVMEQHDGRVEVDSQPGRGTTFRLIFPAVPAPTGPGEQGATP